VNGDSIGISHFIQHLLHLFQRLGDLFQQVVKISWKFILDSLKSWRQLEDGFDALVDGDPVVVFWFCQFGVEDYKWK
jgi:hypothetical protein